MNSTAAAPLRYADAELALVYPTLKSAADSPVQSALVWPYQQTVVFLPRRGQVVVHLTATSFAADTAATSSSPTRQYHHPPGHVWDESPVQVIIDALRFQIYRRFDVLVTQHSAKQAAMAREFANGGVQQDTYTDRWGVEKPKVEISDRLWLSCVGQGVKAGEYYTLIICVTHHLAFVALMQILRWPPQTGLKCRNGRSYALQLDAQPETATLSRAMQLAFATAKPVIPAALEAWNQYVLPQGLSPDHVFVPPPPDLGAGPLAMESWTIVISPKEKPLDAAQTTCQIWTRPRIFDSALGGRFAKQLSLKSSEGAASYAAEKAAQHHANKSDESQVPKKRTLDDLYNLASNVVSSSRQNDNDPDPDPDALWIMVSGTGECIPDSLYPQWKLEQRALAEARMTEYNRLFSENKAAVVAREEERKKRFPTAAA